MKHILLAIAIAAAVFRSAPLLAAEPAAAVQRMGAGIVTSRCVGKTDTPLCAAETFLSCLLRADHRHCAAVDAPPLTMYPLPGFREYRVVSMRTLRGDEEDVEPGIGLFVPPGSAHIVLEERGCPRTGCRYHEWKKANLYLSPQPDGWRIRRWSSQEGLTGFSSYDRVTSRCLGDARSPLCLVESIFACVMRGDLNLCRRAGMPVDGDLCLRDPHLWMTYEVTELEFQGRTVIWPDHDTVLVAGVVDECSDDPRSCRYEGASFGYYFWHKGRRWDHYTGYWTHVEACGSED